MWKDEKMLKILLENSSEKYKNFQEKLIPGKQIIGVPIPQLEKIAKQMIKENQGMTYLDTYESYHYECDILYGMLVAYQKMDEDLRFKYMYNFVSYVDNWATCDYVIARWKFIKKDLRNYLVFVDELLETNKEWYCRVAYVILLAYYLNEEYINEVIVRLRKKVVAQYYTEMAASWLISMGLVKFPDLFETLLEEKEFSDFVYQKSLQKAIESKQISQEKKQQYRQMKKNNC